MKPQKSTFKAYAQQNNFLPIKHYTDGGKSGRFFGGSAYPATIQVCFLGGTLSMNGMLSKCQKKGAQVTKTKG